MDQSRDATDKMVSKSLIAKKGNIVTRGIKRRQYDHLVSPFKKRDNKSLHNSSSKKIKNTDKEKNSENPSNKLHKTSSESNQNRKTEKIKNEGNEVKPECAELSANLNKSVLSPTESKSQVDIKKAEISNENKDTLPRKSEENNDTDNSSCIDESTKFDIHSLEEKQQENEKRKNDSKLTSHKSRDRKRLTNKERRRSSASQGSDTSTTPSLKRKRIPSRPGIIFQIGCRLEAKDAFEKWYPSKIVAVDDEECEVLIHFERWSSRYDEWVAMDSPRLRAITHPSTRKEYKENQSRRIPEYKIGEEVLARWSDCKMYPAKVTDIYENGFYNVFFYDGFHRKLPNFNIEKLPEDLMGKVEFPNLGLASVKDKGTESISSNESTKSFSKTSVKSSSTINKPNKTGFWNLGKKKRLIVGGVFLAKKQKLDARDSRNRRFERLKASEKLSSRKLDERQASRRASSSSRNSLDVSPSKFISEPILPTPSKIPEFIDGRRVARKEFIIEEDHNHYKCKVPGCGKSFRKDKLLYSHIKHYHNKNKNNSRTESPQSTSSRSSTGHISNKNDSSFGEDVISNRSSSEMADVHMENDVPVSPKDTRKKEIEKKESKAETKNSNSESMLSSHANEESLSEAEKEEISLSSNSPNQHKEESKNLVSKSKILGSKAQGIEPNNSELNSGSKESEKNLQELNENLPESDISLNDSDAKHSDENNVNLESKIDLDAKSQSESQKPSNETKKSIVETRKSSSEKKVKLEQQKIPSDSKKDTKKNTSEPLKSSSEAKKSQSDTKKSENKKNTPEIKKSILDRKKSPPPSEGKKTSANTKKTNEIKKTPDGKKGVEVSKSHMETRKSSARRPTYKVALSDATKNRPDGSAFRKGRAEKSSSAHPANNEGSLNRISSPGINSIQSIPSSSTVNATSVSSPTHATPGNRGTKKRRIITPVEAEPVSSSTPVNKADNVAVNVSAEGELTKDGSKTDESLENASALINAEVKQESEAAKDSQASSGLLAEEEIITEELTQTDEVVHCICNCTEEEGLMMQCEVCLGWQHGVCFDIEDEKDVPEKYVCYACSDPAGLRESFRYKHDQDWFKKGEMTTFRFLDENSALTNRPTAVLGVHDLVASMHQIFAVLHSLQNKFNILNSENHEDLNKWSKPWVEDLLELQHDARKYISKNSSFIDKCFTDLNIGQGIHLNNAPITDKKLLLHRDTTEFDHSYFSPKQEKIVDLLNTVSLMTVPLQEESRIDEYDACDLEMINRTSEEEKSNNEKDKTESAPINSLDHESTASAVQESVQQTQDVGNTDSSKSTNCENNDKAKDSDSSVFKTEIDKTNLFSEGEMQQLQTVISENHIDIIKEFSLPSLLTAVKAKGDETTADEVSYDSKNPSSTHSEMVMCKRNLFDHIMHTCGDLELRLNAIEEQVAALETETSQSMSQFDPGGGGDGDDAGKLLASLRGLTSDLAVVQQMAHFS